MHRCPRREPAGLELPARPRGLRLEGLVFADRIAEDITARLAAGDLPPTESLPKDPAEGVGLLAAERRLDVQRTMTDGSGPVRTAESTARTAARLRELLAEPPAAVTTGAWETTNLAHLGLALTTAAQAREETRGGHERGDFPDRDDRVWLGHLDHVRTPEGVFMTFLPQKDADR